VSYVVTRNTIEYNGTDTNTILGPNFNPYNGLRLNRPGNITGFPGLTVNATLEVAQGTFTSASTYHDVLIDNGATLSLSGDVTVSSTWTNDGTFNANTHKVTFNGAANQTIGGANSTAFATLQISNTGSAGTNLVSITTNTSDTALSITSGVFNQSPI